MQEQDCTEEATGGGRESTEGLGRAERAGRCNEEKGDSGSGERATSGLAQKKKVTGTRE